MRLFKQVGLVTSFSPDVDREFGHILDKHMDAVLHAFREGEEPPVHARAGRRALAFAYAAIASYETGARVVVDA